MRSPERDRRHRHSRLLRKPRRTRLPCHRLEVHRDRALGEHRYALTTGQGRDRNAQRLDRVARAALHGNLMRRVEQRTERLLVEQLRLGEVTHPTAAPIGDVRECQRIEIRHVIAREQHRTMRRNVLFAFDGPTQTEAQPGIKRSSGHGIDRIHGR